MAGEEEAGVVKVAGVEAGRELTERKAVATDAAGEVGHAQTGKAAGAVLADDLAGGLLQGRIGEQHPLSTAELGDGPAAQSSLLQHRRRQ